LSDSITEIRVPDIGDFHDVPVIEVLVKPGETIAKESPLLVLESEKASMEVPAPAGGVVHDVRVHVGDKVSQGTVILTLSGNGSNGATAPQATATPAPVSATAAAIELRVPDIGDFHDVPVIEVLVKPGDAVQKEQPLLVLESEKASMEVPASVAGTIADVKINVGDKVSQGTVIATLSQSASPAPKPQAATTETVPPAASPTAPSPVAASPGEPAPSAPAGPALHASPAIRRFARELGVDLHGLSGTGPRGRITREDVQGFVKTALSQAHASPHRGGGDAGLGFAGLPPWPKIDFEKYGTVERKPLSRIKKLSGPNLHRNWLSIPHITNYDEADITELEAFRNDVNAEQAKRGGPKLTMLAFLVKASIAALQRFPEFNASLDGDELAYKRYYNIGFAADTPNGLVVPVLKNADAKGLLAIAAESAELAAKARDGKLGATDMQGGTFTISSIGGIGGTAFTQIVNAPEVAILGAVRSVTKPVWNGSAFEPRLTLPVSVSYDHRVIDGAGAARFLTFLVSVLADFRRVLL
jgi:pyruvate dehydrogenase E2 component (dihydrolipoamide acetyltransferase)